MITFFREFYMYFKYALDGLTNNPISIAKKLKESQYWDRMKIENYQLKQLNNLIVDAKKNVKSYQREKYKNISTFKNLDSFSKYNPIIEKEYIRENADFLISNNNNKRFKHYTGGSTGKPLSVDVSELAVAYRIASHIRFYNWWGINMFDRNVLIWKKRKQKKSMRSFFKKIELKLLGRLELDVFNINDRTIFDYFNKIENFKPKYIRGYKSGVFELARLMEKHNLQFTNSKLKMVVVTSETLFLQERLFIEKILKCKVANEYGAADGGLYAVECPDGSLHINEESVFISSDMDDSAYSTELFNNTMPLINYRNEDIVVFSDRSCSCGRNLKVIKEIKGRISDYILCSDGTKKHCYAADLILENIAAKYKDSITQFRITQINYKLKIKIIPGNNFVKELFREIESEIFVEISKDLEIEFQLVQHIKREKNGKLRTFIRK